MNSKKSALEIYYKEKIVPELMSKFQYTSIMQVPKLEKVVVNMGVGDAVQDSKRIEDAIRELEQIVGQKPIITKAKKSLAVFKLREGMAIGCKVDLRGKKMYDFVSKLFNIALPRVRDFKGVSKNSFDKQANYSMGVKEQIIFPEIDYDKIKKIRGMDITFVVSSKTKEESFTLLQLMGMPFTK